MAMDGALGTAVQAPVSDRGGAAAAAALEERIGYAFTNRDLLTTALTHSSAVNDAMASYQRLEFLGDRVLALVISEMLIETFPRAAEGELAQRLTALVRNEACAEVARALDLGEAIRLGGGEAQSGGRRKAAILGDACEGLIGAIYLDGGLEPARRFVVDNWRGKMIAATSIVRDAKTTLQEWAQGRGLAAPAYAIVGRSGPDHAPRFEVEVNVVGLSPHRGAGRTRREAEQDAAAAALVDQGVWNPDGRAA
jgi:ribonuclease-3